jgi:hypothetical protein
LPVFRYSPNFKSLAALLANLWLKDEFAKVDRMPEGEPDPDGRLDKVVCKKTLRPEARVAGDQIGGRIIIIERGVRLNIRP